MKGAIIKLRQVLKLSRCNHKKEILKQSNLKTAHIYCKINNLSGQISGPLIEFYIQNKYKMTKNKSSLCIGDLQRKKINYEIKVSTGGKDNNKFNYVQMRFNHNCEYLLTAYYINESNLRKMGELFIFKLTKLNMKKLILKFGGYAHGTVKQLGKITDKDLNYKNNKEYAIRPTYGDKCWNELLKYRIEDI